MARVAIVGGCRTPFVRAAGALSQFSAIDLSVHVVRALVKRLAIDSARIDEMAFGTVLLDPRLPNFAREVVLRSGLSPRINAHAVSNNCITGLVAASLMSDAIRQGRVTNAIAGGSESMSKPALTVSKRCEEFFIGLSRARSFGERLQWALKFRPGFLLPQPPSPKEPTTGLTMGQHCELTTQEFAISREVQDQIALSSHRTAAQARDDGFLKEDIEPLGGVEVDNLVRADTTIEKLAKLKPVFDRGEKGTLTAGNSSSLTDGASAVCLMSEDVAKKEGRAVVGYIDGYVFSAIAPADGLLMAPCLALPRLMAEHNLRMADIDLFEIHEAFAAQVAANLSVWEQGWKKFPELRPIGAIPREKMNVHGGSIALGHPFAATGGRLIMSAARGLKKRGGKTAVISVCAAGGMACAMLIRSQ